MSRVSFTEPTNPYHYIVHCLGGKWKMTLLHGIHAFGRIRFNESQRVLPISEKVLSQQLKELVDDGLIQRIVDGSTYPPSIDYVLTRAGAQLLPALDMLYIWSIRQMYDKGIPIDEDAFIAHQDDCYVEQLKDIMEERQRRARAGRRPAGSADKVNPELASIAGARAKAPAACPGRKKKSSP